MSIDPLMNSLEHTEDAGEVVEVANTQVIGDGTRERLPVHLSKGDQLGRYTILRRLGAGAMGTVYLGYDPELDRKVALKILRGATSESSRRALLREAQAMAKLRHANVVAVHDVGEHQGRVYVAMEFVEGGTLRQWLRAERRSWRELLDKFLAAGRGLQAAHDQGLIHRDFKPDNVMVSNQGQVLVMDFGLARPSRAALESDSTASSAWHGAAESSQASDDGVEDSRGPSSSTSSALLSEATVGHVAGTPGYMSPEQLNADVLTPASDQFGFCVSVWEALCGQRPFEGSSIVELYFNTSEGRVRPLPAGAQMPRWLARVLLRGLAPDPSQRWPSLRALLAAIERGLGRWRWQAALVVSTLLALGGAATISWQQQQARAEREVIAHCEAEGRAIDEIWNDEARQRVRAGLLDTKLSFAADSIDTLIPWLDEYHQAWSSGRTQACLSASLTGEWDEELLDRSTWCFEDRRLQLEATVNQIATIDSAAARRAVRLASYLDPIETCLDANALRRLPTPPAELRDDVRRIRATLSESDRQRHAGRYTEALAVARQALVSAEALGWSPLVASARFSEGQCLHVEGRSSEAELVLTRAYFEALDAGSVEVAFRAARTLTGALTALERYHEAELWFRHGEALSPELIDFGGLDEAEGHYLLVRIHLGLGDYEVAAEHGRAAVAMRSEALGADHPITASSMTTLGQVYLAQQRPRQALELFERSYAIWEDAVGHVHPYVGGLALLRGSALVELGRAEAGLAMQEDGLAIYEQVLQPEHPKLAEALGEIGMVYLALGRLDEAEHALQRELTIQTSKHGRRHPAVALSLLNIAMVDRARGREELARERCEQASEILAYTRPAGHRDLELAQQRCDDVGDDADADPAN